MRGGEENNCAVGGKVKMCGDKGVTGSGLAQWLVIKWQERKTGSETYMYR